MGSIFLTQQQWNDVRATLMNALGDCFVFPADNRSGWIERGSHSGSGDALDRPSPAPDKDTDKAQIYARHYD